MSGPIDLENETVDFSCLPRSEKRTIHRRIS